MLIIKDLFIRILLYVKKKGVIIKTMMEKDFGEV